MLLLLTLLKFNNRDTRTRSVTFSDVFITTLEQISHVGRVRGMVVQWGNTGASFSTCYAYGKKGISM